MPDAIRPDLTDHPLQLGGIRTGSLDHPQPMGGRSVRVALFDNAVGLSFTVVLDRAGDIVQARHHGHSLTFLSPNGIGEPSHAYHRGLDWLRNWPGGLMTTCGPSHIGAPDPEDTEVTLHGRVSNRPVAVLAVRQPDPKHGLTAMGLDLLVRDSRVFGPSYEIRRTIESELHEPVIRITDRVTNVGDTPAPHHWMYHLNLGHPLIAPGARLVYGGTHTTDWDTAEPASAKPTPTNFADFKTLPEPMPTHRGAGERGVILTPVDRDGVVTIGAVNPALTLGLSITYPSAQLPRLVNWQHFSPGGMYVTGLEPFQGSLPLPGWDDTHPQAHPMLEPEESRDYTVEMRALDTAKACDALLDHDAPLAMS